MISLHEMSSIGKIIHVIAKETAHSRNILPISEVSRHPRENASESPLLRIQEQRYQGGRTILKDYVKALRPPKQAPAI